MKSCYHQKLDEIGIKRRIMSRKYTRMDKLPDKKGALEQEFQITNSLQTHQYKDTRISNQLSSEFPSFTVNDSLIDHQPCAMLDNHRSNQSQSCAGVLSAGQPSLGSRQSLLAKPAKLYPTNRCLNMKKATRSLANKNLFQPTLVSVTIATLALFFCVITHIQGDANISPSIDNNDNNLPSASQDIKQNSNDRSDEPLVKNSESTAPNSASSASQNSIVASLSSAVASAAAAAAVAAAQNSLSGADARSLLTGGAPSKGHHPLVSNGHAQRSSSGLHLAIKLADAIPEVPYNILHNMKKLDHAAPFYNVPNKLASSTAKESGQNFLSSALIASGGLGGAAEQFGALFKSPLWKRLADGYGDFASEFRSLFRGSNRVTPMKGPTSSSTAKLIRDISVPALLMLLASTGIQGSDWRPGRTRRKSFAPVGVPHTVGGQLNGSPISTDLQGLSSLAPSLGPILSDNKQPTGLSSYLSGSLNNPGFAFNTNYNANNNNNQPPQFESSNQINALGAAGGDLSLLQGAESQSRPSWLTPVPSQQQQIGSSSDHLQLEPQQNIHLPHNHHEQLQPQHQQQHQQQLQQHQPQQAQALRRSGEYSNPAIMNSHSSNQQGQQQVLKPAARNDGDNERPGQSSSVSITRDGAYSTGLLGSLTSSLNPSKLMNKIFNAKNLNGNPDSMKATSDESPVARMMLPIKRDQLSDKQRYTLIGPDDNNLAHFANLNEPIRLSGSPSKPFLLSAMTHAIASVLNTQQQESGSASGDENRPTIGNNLINQARDSLTRRQPQGSPSSSFRPEGNKVEQRDLSQFLPPTWREVVKRTVNNVQQQASSQWKSIEGQLANWVQDKIKSLPVGASSSTSSSSSAVSSTSALGTGSSSGGASGTASSPQRANILASVGSTAMNMLGLGNKNSSSRNASAALSTQNASIDSADHSAPETSGNSAATVNGNAAASQKSKPIGQQLQQVAKGTLAGVADIIVNSLSGRTSAAQASPVASSSSSSSSSSSAIISTNSGTTTDTKKAPIGTELIQSMTSVASQYPTLTGAQVSTDFEKTTMPLSSASSSSPSVP